MLFDLNNLKATNDHFSHEAGDAILLRLASSLGAAEQPNRRVCRIGGDEFVMLRRNCTQEELESDSAAVQRELDRLNAGESLPCTAAVGLVGKRPGSGGPGQAGRSADVRGQDPEKTGALLSGFPLSARPSLCGPKHQMPFRNIHLSKIRSAC